jgi:hypothetical protein
MRTSQKDGTTRTFERQLPPHSPESLVLQGHLKTANCTCTKVLTFSLEHWSLLDGQDWMNPTRPPQRRTTRSVQPRTCLRTVKEEASWQPTWPQRPSETTSSCPWALPHAELSVKVDTSLESNCNASTRTTQLAWCRLLPTPERLLLRLARLARLNSCSEVGSSFVTVIWFRFE